MSLPQGLHLTLPAPKGAEHILSTEALEFLAVLHRTFDARRLELLENRKKVQKELDAVSGVVTCGKCGGLCRADTAQGKPLTFLPETKDIRDSPSWACAQPARGLEDRR